MSDIQMMKIINQEIRNKWKFIVIIGIVFAFIFIISRNIEGKFVIQSGDVVITRIISCKNKNDNFDYLNYDKYIMSTTNMMNFYKYSKNKIDYNKLLIGWEIKSDLQKEDWLRKHFKVFYFGNGKLEIQLRIMHYEPKDIKYIKENGNYILDNLTDYINKLDLNNNFIIEQSFVSMPQELTIPRNRILLKYGIIGFFLGEILTLVLIILNGVRKNHGRSI